MFHKVINDTWYNMDNYIQDNTIDLVVTSPPYNVNLGDNKYNKNPYDLYQDNVDHQKYLIWLEDGFQMIYKLLKSGGRVCINIGDGKNGAVPTSADIIYFMTKRLTYIPTAHIYWNKNQVSPRTAWGSYMSPSSPSFPTPVEHILVFAKENKKIQYTGDTDLTKDEFVKWSNALWNIAPERGMRRFGHPAMFPEELPKRLIKMLSWKDAFVVDPFNGAGTTQVAAANLGRSSYGFDISKEYCDIAEKRLSTISKAEKWFI